MDNWTVEDSIIYVLGEEEAKKFLKKLDEDLDITRENTINVLNQIKEQKQEELEKEKLNQAREDTINVLNQIIEQKQESLDRIEKYALGELEFKDLQLQDVSYIVKTRDKRFDLKTIEKLLRFINARKQDKYEYDNENIDTVYNKVK